ncbi:porin family protein [Subsaxibacter sp. CAU 1640]|uniref:porin family protein n=1 Tax=Subsaxibacter sp. CAU 1640 TaxID=2933271 RepID=UPI0020059586|nr:porin family protein [Subsaxibacter sp. CAU 1640]MCK7591121.1 porin family protein [Subsaxibacter sp. CAU 1640]
MKKLITLLLFASLSTLTFSQETKYGVRAGLNISNLDFTPDADFQNLHRNGFTFGGFVDYGFTELISLQVELQYSAEGGKADDLKADYIQMPLMLRFHIGDKFTIGAGPMASLKTWKNQDAFSTFSFSGIGGVEYVITDELFIDARFSYGITNILDEDFEGIEAKNNNIQIGIGIKI